MKHALFMLLIAVFLTGLTACAKHGMVVGTCRNCPETCRPVAPCADGCPHGGCRGYGRASAGPDSVPPSGAVTYPYYTLHGPRDFLSSNPRPIGP
jgi:hypothetical protein